MGKFETKVLGIRGSFTQKFILIGQTNPSDEAVLKYAAASLSFIEYHREIPDFLNLRFESGERILGGGYVRSADDNCLYLYRDSGDFGAVPKIVLEQFEPVLLEAYKDYGVNSVEFDPSGRTAWSWAGYIRE